MQKLKTEIALSCAVLVPYLPFLASLSVPLVALSSTKRFSLTCLYLREDTRHARPLTSSVLTIPSCSYLLCTVHPVSGGHFRFRWILVSELFASHILTVTMRVEPSSLFTCCIYSLYLWLLSKTVFGFYICIIIHVWAGYLSRYSDWLRAGRSGIESRWGRDFPPVQTGPGAHPASCTMGTGSFLWIEAAGAWGWPLPPH